METIVTRGRTVEVPSDVSELTPDQYEYYCVLASALSSGLIDMARFRVRWLSWLVGLGHADYTMLMPRYVAELDAQAGFVDRFIIPSGESGGERLDFLTPANLMPHYGGFDGPGDWLDGVTFGEFVQCLTILGSLPGTGGEEDAEGCRAIARTLYHIPAGAEVPPLLAFHAPTFMGAVWRLLQAGPVEINGRRIDFRILFRNSGPRRPDDKTGWTGITFEVATAGLFGSVPEVEKTDLWAVLLYLYKCKFEYINDKHNNRTP